MDRSCSVVKSETEIKDEVVLEDESFTKCGEVFFYRAGKFKVSCSLCDRKYENISDFVYHIVQDEDFKTSGRNFINKFLQINLNLDEDRKTETLLVESNDLIEKIDETLLVESNDLIEKNYETEDLVLNNGSNKRVTNYETHFTASDNYDSEDDGKTLERVLQSKTAEPSDTKIHNEKRKKINEPKINIEDEKLTDLKLTLDLSKKKSYWKNIKEVKRKSKKSISVVVNKKQERIHWNTTGSSQTNETDIESINNASLASNNDDDKTEYTNKITKKKLKIQKHVCEHCGKETDSLFNMKIHLKVHDENRTYYNCSLCEKKFLVKESLESHIRFHKNERPFECQYCKKLFVDESRKKAHEKIHTHEKKYECSVCQKKFLYQSKLNEHTLIYHIKGRRFECPNCEKRFFDEYTLKIHMPSHTNEKPFNCDVCSAKFPRKSGLLVHKKLHSDKKEYVCKICKKEFAIYNGIYAHYKSHGIKYSLAYEKGLCEPEKINS